jgi:hypothetical protein
MEKEKKRLHRTAPHRTAPHTSALSVVDLRVAVAVAVVAAVATAALRCQQHGIWLGPLEALGTALFAHPLVVVALASWFSSVQLQLVGTAGDVFIFSLA